VSNEKHLRLEGFLDENDKWLTIEVAQGGGHFARAGLFAYIEKA
jgi:hypothetical protein